MVPRQVRGSALFAGPTGAGKTTALGAFLRAVPRDQCVRVVEEVRELNLPLSLHSSFYQASGIGLSGERRYGLRDLIKVCLAMRVDMLCVGEVRGPEAFELTRAINAGGGLLLHRSLRLGVQGTVGADVVGTHGRRERTSRRSPHHLL